MSTLVVVDEFTEINEETWLAIERHLNKQRKNMKNKFTKGPWRVLKRDAKDYLINPCNNELPAIVENIENKANAQLIAAAPEMFEALEAALELIKQTEEQSGLEFEVTKEVEKVIKKARGKE